MKKKLNVIIIESIISLRFRNWFVKKDNNEVYYGGPQNLNSKNNLKKYLFQKTIRLEDWKNSFVKKNNKNYLNLFYKYIIYEWNSNAPYSFLRLLLGESKNNNQSSLLKHFK